MFCKIKKSIKEYREWQLKFYTRAQDTLEQRLAGISAARAKLEEQIKRDATEKLHDDIRNSDEN
tara:strand:+ start:527 stop:718 length:192 start_codon:yes stop_codon:yes gene_type:complete